MTYFFLLNSEFLEKNKIIIFVLEKNCIFTSALFTMICFLESQKVIWEIKSNKVEFTLGIDAFKLWGVTVEPDSWIYLVL